MKKFYAALILLAGMTILISCAVVERQAKAGPTVYTGLSDFIEHSVTLHKGEWLKIEAKVTSLHVITNGSWENGVAHPYTEAGAPIVNKTVNTVGESITIGPFHTAGSFHLYCTVHQGMNLAINVNG